MAPPPDAQAEWPRGYVHGGWFPRDARHDSSSSDEVQPVPPPPPLVRADWQDCCCCLLVVFLFCAVAVPFRGWLVVDDYSILLMVNFPALVLARMHLLVVKSSPAPPLPACPAAPAPALWSPPVVCYEWEKPTSATMVLPGSSGSADIDWRSDERDGDYKCKPMNYFDGLVMDAAMTCFVWSYDTIPVTRQSDDPPPSLQHD